MRVDMQRLEIAPDTQFVTNIIINARLLGIAYYFTGELHYAERLVQKVRKFFLDEQTGMLPAMEYASVKPGIDKVGRPEVRHPPRGPPGYELSMSTVFERCLITRNRAIVCTALAAWRDAGAHRLSKHGRPARRHLLDSRIWSLDV